jgi:hypothetical protein
VLAFLEGTGAIAVVATLAGFIVAKDVIGASAVSDATFNGDFTGAIAVGAATGAA